jgi:hypothetical protein
VRDHVERDHSEELIDRHLAERALHDLVEVLGSERRLCRGSGRGERRLRVGTGGITWGRSPRRVVASEDAMPACEVADGARP